MITLSLPLRASLAPFVLALAACTTTSSGDGSGGTSDYAGVYNATFTGTYQNSSPNTESGSSTSTAVITVTDLSPTEVELSWQVAPNPPSGDAVFVLSGATGILADAGASDVSGDAGGVAVGGSCFTGLVNGNTQTSCCTTCSLSFSDKTFTQPNAGYYTGTTPQGVAYKGTYSGTWTGTLQ